MKNSFLQFDSLLNLWCFKERAQLTNIQIKSGKCLLIGELPDSLIALAIEHYNARVVAMAAAAVPSY